MLGIVHQRLTAPIVVEFDEYRLSIPALQSLYLLLTLVLPNLPVVYSELPWAIFETARFNETDNNKSLIRTEKEANASVLNRIKKKLSSDASLRGETLRGSHLQNRSSKFYWSLPGCNECMTYGMESNVSDLLNPEHWLSYARRGVVPIDWWGTFSARELCARRRAILYQTCSRRWKLQARRFAFIDMKAVWKLCVKCYGPYLTLTPSTAHYGLDRCSGYFPRKHRCRTQLVRPVQVLVDNKRRSHWNLNWIRSHFIKEVLLLLLSLPTHPAPYSIWIFWWKHLVLANIVCSKGGFGIIELQRP